LYFRIGEVSGLVGVEPHVLRYWEREFARTIRPTKSAKGQRVYSRRDVENLMRVRELLYTEGFTIAGARKQLAPSKSAPPLAQDETEAPAPAGGEADDAAAQAAPSLEPEALASPSPAIRPSLDAARAEVSARLHALRDELQAFLGELGG
jgi:DNA-binding transcriptional MerR regulator